MLDRLDGAAYDVVVVGGGITGAGVARDAAMRGMRVALFERGDFASGTSSASSKLLHGGIRYLEQLEFHLVWESLNERATLCALAPHLARPVPFLFPLYEGHPVGPFKLDLGLWLYDGLAGYKNLGLHKRMSPRAMRAREPRLRAEGLRGGCSYYDAVTDDARLTLENARSAWEHGADCLSYMNVEELRFSQDKVAISGSGGGSQARLESVDVQDIAEGGRGERFTVRARCVVNACGPWSDGFRGKAGLNRRLLRPTKGVHVLLPRRFFPEEHAVVMTSSSDKRILFVIPWGTLTIVGTTDTDADPSRGPPQADAADVRYILDMLNEYFPQMRVVEADVLATYAGFRPLIHEERDAPSSVSREHRIMEERPGFITVAGGKLTTYRRMARAVVDLVARVLRRDGAATWGSHRDGHRSTDREPLVTRLDDAREPASGLPPEDFVHLCEVYGPRAVAVGAVARRGGAALGRRLTTHSPDFLAQVVYAFESEMAIHLEDALSRRTHALLSGITAEEAASVSAALAPVLGWNSERLERELARFGVALSAARPLKRDEMPR